MARKSQIHLPNPSTGEMELHHLETELAQVSDMAAFARTLANQGVSASEIRRLLGIVSATESAEGLLAAADKKKLNAVYSSAAAHNGIYRGRYIDFEAKECSLKTSFPLKSIHLHQVKHLEACMRHGGIAFLIVRFTHLDETYLVPADRISAFWYHHDRSSIPYAWFRENGTEIPGNYVKPVDYLKIVDRIYFEEGGSTSNGEN